MTRTVKCGLIQASCDWQTPTHSLKTIKEKMIAKHVALIEKAGRLGVQILSLQEIFAGPYFPAEQDAKWYDMAEADSGPTVRLMRALAKRFKMAMVVPIFETPQTGVYYNTAVVIDADGSVLGKYRKNHLPHCAPGFWEKFYFKPGNLGYPVFKTRHAKIGVYLCYDRHFPEGARLLGLAGAEIVFNPSATVAGLSEYLWKLEQPAHCAANQYFIGAVNRVGREKPWNIGEFYGQSYFCNPHGKIVAEGPRDRDALITAELDLGEILKTRKTWQFFRDRRPETYGGLTELLP